jgi:hypothetical protein
VNRVVDLVFEHIRHRPSFSLAVVTASPRHAARVGEAIRLQMVNFPWAADFFAPGRESFRVVPVDRAAGLVRDDVIFSLGFGRTPHGRAVHSFGPLSAPDGRRKFVLAMTRARRRLHVLTCFQPTDLDPERLSAGAADFYELLLSELGGSAPVETPASSNTDPLVADLVERLRARGAEVRDHYDGVLDIVATRPPSAGGFSEGGYPVAPLAIESDGTGRYGAMTVRERSRLRPQQLERMGWRYMPLWTIEVFTDPEGCAERAATELGLVTPEASEPPKTRRDALRMMKNDSTGDGRNPRPAAGAATAAATAAGPVLPKTAAEDDPQAWGDAQGDSDEWLKEQRPPHWS